MIDVVLVTLFCYQLSRLARLRGLPSMPFVLNYLAIFTLVMLMFVFGFTYAFGPNALNSAEGIKAALMFEPFAIMFEVFLFIYFRKRIQRTTPVDNDDDYNRPEPPKEKKDLSYFR